LLNNAKSWNVKKKFTIKIIDDFCYLMKLSNNIKYISNECADNVQQLLARKYKRDHLLFTVDHHGQLPFLPSALVLPNTEMLTV
jgi:hypothetical protein